MPAAEGGESMSRLGFGNPDEVKRLSEEALQRADEHRTPPSPMIYELWFGYAQGVAPELNEQLDRHLSRGEDITPELARRLHDAFFSDIPLKRGLSHFGSEIAEKISEVHDMVAANESDMDGHAKSLGGLAAKIARQTTPEQLLHSAERLGALAACQQAAAQALTQELAAARHEMLGFREELEKLQRLCETDHLTKISNRRHFDERIHRTLEAVKSDDRKACLAIADIDFFKRFNDSFGHSAGDKVLVKFAEILRTNAKASDLPARLGGEEFALILENVSLNGADQRCNDIREYLMQASFSDPEGKQRPARVTCSFGATAMRPDDDVASLLARADSLLYDAKSMGRNKVVCGL